MNTNVAHWNLDHQNEKETKITEINKTDKFNIHEMLEEKID